MNALYAPAVLALGWGFVLGCGGDDSGSSGTDEVSGLFIQGNVARLPPNCEARAEQTAALLDLGTLDVGLKLDYEASLLVGSPLHLIPAIEGAAVSLYSDTGALETTFTVPTSGGISPDRSGKAAHGIILATLVPQTTGHELETELHRGEVRALVADVSVFGKTADGLSVASTPSRFIVKVCLGCLVDFPPAALQGNSCNQQLDQAPESPCRLGQDAAVDCRSCAASNPICQTAG